MKFFDEAKTFGPKVGELKPYFRMQIENGHFILKFEKIGI